jgi:nucleotide-binding universal stress UspA family protein
MEAKMFKHILLPTDGSERSEFTAAKGVEFARHVGARVTALHVMPTYPLIAYVDWGPIDPLTEERFQQEGKQRAEMYLDHVDTIAKQAGVLCAIESRSSDHPWEAIIEVAKDKQCDLIFMASHGRRGLAGLLMGSETNKVLTHTDIPVLVWR